MTEEQRTELFTLLDDYEDAILMHARRHTQWAYSEVVGAEEAIVNFIEGLTK